MDYDLAAIFAAEADNGRVAHGATLVRFVDAVLTGTGADYATAREAVIKAVGDAAFVDVCATVASFNAVVKIADATGIPLEDAKAERTRDLRASYDIDRLRKT